MCALLTLTPDVARAEIAVGVNGIVAGAEFSGPFRLQRFVSDGSRLLAPGMLTVRYSSTGRPSTTISFSPARRRSSSSSGGIAGTS